MANETLGHKYRSSMKGEMAREFNNKSTLNISDGYHISTLTVYF